MPITIYSGSTLALRRGALQHWMDRQSTRELSRGDQISRGRCTDRRIAAMFTRSWIRYKNTGRASVTEGVLPRRRSWSLRAWSTGSLGELYIGLNMTMQPPHTLLRLSDPSTTAKRRLGWTLSELGRFGEAIGPLDGRSITTDSTPTANSVMRGAGWSERSCHCRIHSALQLNAESAVPYFGLATFTSTISRNIRRP
jgi:hypothetical protein